MPTAATRTEEAVGLLPHHKAMVRESGITPEVAQERGYRSVTRKADLATLGFTAAQRNVPTLLIPVHGVDGEVRTYQSRPDHPRISREGKPLKYETPRGSSMCLDVPPSARERLGDPSTPLWITEGARKADAAVSAGLCCIALLGVWNFRGRNEHGGVTALADWESVQLRERRVYLCFDSDVNEKPAVYGALKRLRAFLEARGAEVRVVYLPPLPGGSKCGLDDFLAAGRTVADLLQCASADLRRPPGMDEERPCPYAESERGITWNRETAEGTVPVPLCNFTARITKDGVRDDGVEEVRTWEIEARLNGRTRHVSLPVARFTPVDKWAREVLGAGAIVRPGSIPAQHLPGAIQTLSGDVPESREYAHTGWREVNGEQVYLHAGGGIGADGPVQGVSVALQGPLAAFHFPDPPEGEALREAVQASLAVIGAASFRITVPLLGAVYRAALGPAPFSLHLTGPSGAGKSEAAALAQQHWGAALDARNLPASWSSTDNALEALASQAKDALLVVDDFKPTGSQYDVQVLHRKADRVLRAQGNGSGRGRLRPDGTPRPVRPPRGTIFSTGEDTPKGQSLRARTMVTEVGPGDVDFTALTRSQEDARAGKLAGAMAAYVRWLAPRMPVDVRAQAAERRPELEGAHRRTAEIVGHLRLGWDLFLEFAVAVGAVEQEDAEVARTRVDAALIQAAEAQQHQQEGEEPATRFLGLLRGAFTAGRAHVTNLTGLPPENPGGWGWHRAGMEWREQGERVGWLDGEDLYLEPEAAYRAARTFGDGMDVSPRTLNKRLAEAGLLRSRDPSQGTLTARKYISALGKQRSVLHLHRDALDAHGEAEEAEPFANLDRGGER